MASKFNKAAIALLPIGTAYALGGRFAAAAAGASFLLGHALKDPYSRASALEIEQAAVGYLDRSTYIGNAILSIKEEAGIDDELRLLVCRSTIPAAVAGTKPLTLFISESTIESLAPEDVIEIAKHELGHVKHRDTDTLGAYHRGGLWAAKFNTYLGGLLSLATVNLLPILGALTSRAGNKFLMANLRRNAEHRADEFAGEYGDPRAYHRALSLLSGGKAGFIVNAVKAQREHLSRLPGFVARFLARRRWPTPLARLGLATEHVFSDSHPSLHSRLQRTAAAARRTHPDFEPAVHAPEVINICTSCTDTDDPAAQHNLSIYLREKFRSVHGHANVRLQFEDACGGMARAMPMPGMIVITMSMPMPDDHPYPDEP